MNEKRALFGILLVAALLRLAGIGYGLPLWLVGDEPAFIFGSLKMMELRSIIPALHFGEFIGTFYYTPYLSYLYLVPFGAVAGIRYFLFSGSLPEFLVFLRTDLSQFFLAARLFSVAIGTATVYLLYRIGKQIFGRSDAGLAAAAFLGFSFLHVNFSHWARHWVPATFIFSLVLFFLSHPVWSAKKRYLLASFVTGVGMGVTQQVGLITIFITLWFFVVDRCSVKTFRAWWPGACAGIFLLLSLIAYALWPPGFYVAAGATGKIAEAEKTFSGLFSGFPYYTKNLASAEPILLLFFLLGVCIAVRRRRRQLIAYACFITFYVVIFYLVFLHVDRFLLLLYPVLCLLAAEGLIAFRDAFRGRMNVVLTIVPFFFMAGAVIRYDALLMKNDTRIQAIQFVQQILPPRAKILVLVPLMRLPATAAAIDEQTAIDAASLRSVDIAERQLPDALLPRRFHALNAYMIRDVDFLSNIREYMRSHGYEYVLYEPLLAKERVGDAFENMGTTLGEFRGYSESRGDSIVNGVGDGWRQLWDTQAIGPDIFIKKL